MNLIFALLTAAVSYASIPEYSLIASHMADQHGKGSFMIEQDVILKKDGEAFTVRETWLVNNENSMRVTLEGRGPLKGLVQGTMVYEGAQRFFADPASSRIMVQRLGDAWLEPLFHFRNSKWFRQRLVNLKVAPPDSLRDRAPLPSEGDLKYEPPSFIHFSRAGGAIAWEIAQTPAANGGNRPAIWIEQDEFVLRKFRGPDQTVVKANDYNKYDDGLYFPRNRAYTFGNFTVEVQTVQVKSLGKLKTDDARFKPSSLTVSRDGLKFPDADGLREFYQRFR